MHILAIETSCDETAIALIKPTGTKTKPAFSVLSHIVSSQAKLHAEWGGVVPNLAKREHQKNLAPILLRVLKNAKLKVQSAKLQSKNKKFLMPKAYSLEPILQREPELLKQFMEKIMPLQKPPINLIAVTQGPGLEPALWVGVNFARALSYWWDIPLIGINHMEGHVFSALLKEQKRIFNFQFSIFKQIPNSKKQISNKNTKYYMLHAIHYPALALLVSGGHTELVLIKKPLQYEIIGETLDDAAGEAFDKVARILELGYPGGPAIAAEANLEARLPLGSRASKLPRPMLNSPNYDFSFSGLKTAVLYFVRDLQQAGHSIKKLRPAIAKEFQDAVVDVLVSKTIRAAKQYKVKTILLGGGVAANKRLQNGLGEAVKNDLPNSKFYIPDSNVTGDNALMIAVAALQRTKQAIKTAWKTLKPDTTIRL